MMADPTPQTQRPIAFRIAGWLAALLLVAGWMCLALGLWDKNFDLVTYYFCAHFGAFIIGMMSFGRVGGISAILAALTMMVWFGWMGTHPVAR